MDFRILGPLDVLDGGEPVALGGSRQRALLALLLIHAGEAVSSDRLIEALWGSATAGKTLQVTVSRLRKALGADGAELLRTREHGYELRIAPEQLDAHRFTALLARARDELAAGRAAEAAALLDDALALWRGRPLDDLAYEPFAQPEIARLEELRAEALEQRVEARLALGRHAEVVGELPALIEEHPYRERLRAQFMLALYRGDRQADALRAYQDARRTLVDELGIEPGEPLRELERAILAHDPALAAPVAPTAATPEAPPARDTRRLVSVVVAGLPPASGRDPEALHADLDRLGAVIARHGGSVEPSAGETVVGMFGQTELHEDDALRAARAAVELCDAGATRAGLEAGEMFVGAGFAAGDAAQAAAALEAAAADGEILVGEGAARLLRGAVETDGGGRLVALVPAGEAIARSQACPFVGRRAELAQLRAAFEHARDAQACVGVTVVGPAGMGKSRLTRELIAGVADEATVAVGRCPAYGEDATYRPLAEIVAQLGDPGELLAGDEAAAALVRAAIGQAGGAAQPGETAWAVRRLLEAPARERPLVVVVEDVHWAEPTLLDLLEYVLAISAGHAILVVALARPDLLERRPAWAAPRPEHTLIALDALPDAEARALVAHAAELGGGVATRIVELAEGNPLFLEHLAAVGAEDAGAALPASIQAVLATRIARLDPGERELLEDASVQGRSFRLGAIGPQADLTRSLVGLVGKQLVRPERGEDAFAFAHALLREAAYHGLPKRRRAELHEQVARWRDAEDEAAGHHLAEAYRYRAELGSAPPELAAEAAARLAAAADAALLRGDAPAGARLLERAVALDGGAELASELGAALFEAGRMADAAGVLDAAIAAAPSGPLRARAEVERALVRLETEADAGGAEALAVADGAADALAGDVDGQARLWLLRGQAAWYGGRIGEADDAWRRAAELAGRRRTAVEVIGWRATAAVLGPTPVDAAIERCEAFLARVQGSPLATASTLNPLASLHAMRGDGEAAERHLAEAAEILAELGGLGFSAAHLEGYVRLVAGRPAAAEVALRADLDALPAMGEGATLATSTALLAQAVFAQGRVDEALGLCDTTAARAAPHDIVTQAIWRGVRAKAVALAGRHGEAEALARAAVALLAPTDLLSHHGDAMLDLAEVLRTCGRAEEAEQVARDGLALYERKGNAAAAARALAQLG